VVGALALIEREMARAPTAAGLAHLGLMYSLMGQNQRAFQIVQQGLAAWPQDLRLLSLGSRVAGYVGDATTQIKLLERAVAVDPADPVLSNMLRQAREASSPIVEPISG
jgi:tetratricopeptide (TPR) repeat protein